ncbi:MAG: metal-dependent hydrolase, partial [Acidobacteriota bacterium]|nr:metal-dependent hydrolase [Acidobacteriota bacterium]
MDNLCHTLTGAALGQAGLANRTRYGMATLLVASNLPDIDAAVFFTGTLAVSFRRGWTHGLLAQVLLPVALAAVVWTIAARRTAREGPQTGDGQRQVTDGRQPLGPIASGVVGVMAPEVRFSQLVLLAYVGLYSHIYLDYLNSYGLRWLMPFSGRWFYGDALYIVEPMMWLVLGGGVWLAARASKRGLARPWRPARAALVCAAAYTVLMLLSNVWAR